MKKWGRRNNEGIEKIERETVDDEWQMLDGGWQMLDGVC
jgi:hypothetical protein